MTNDLIRAMIIDDEQRGINALQRLLEVNCPNVSVVAVSTDTDEAARLIDQHQPSLVFLDIAMPEKTGFQFLNDLPDINFEIIFVTAHNHFALQAFHFSAIDYLLKPVETDLLKNAIKRVQTRLQNQSSKRSLETLLFNTQQNRVLPDMKLCIPSLKGFQVVNIREIIYCEASSNYTNFHLTDGTVLCASKSIQEYEELLADAGLIRVHKSFLVNLIHIREYLRGEGGTILLTNQIEVEVSRRRKEQFITVMKEFFKY